MTFKKGQSGNPAGRPKGVLNPATHLRKQIAEFIPAIITRMAEAARNGDTAAASLLLSRVIPPARPESQTATVENAGGTLAERAEAIATATLSGEIPTSTASDLMNVLQGMARIKEIDELDKRLTAIEERLP